MKESKTQYSLSFFEALALTFIVLKLTGVISWRWLWVLAPIWGQLILVGLIMVIGLIALKVKDRI